jgi:acetate kinase
MFTYQLKKYIGAYAAVMGGIDILVFTGGIGENSSIIRSMVVANLGFLGIVIDPERNQEKMSRDTVISTDGAGATVVVIKANEEKMIAQEALTIVKGLKTEQAVLLK